MSGWPLQIGGATTLVIDGDDLGTAPRLLLPFAAKQTLKPGATARRAVYDVTLDDARAAGLPPSPRDHRRRSQPARGDRRRSPDAAPPDRRGGPPPRRAQRRRERKRGCHDSFSRQGRTEGARRGGGAPAGEQAAAHRAPVRSSTPADRLGVGQAGSFRRCPAPGRASRQRRLHRRRPRRRIRRARPRASFA